MTPLFFKTRAEWRKWLAKNHKTSTEVTVGYYKKSTGKPTINYEESVEEALCFGWIDGIRNARDDESYVMRFTPRKPKSVWSLINTQRVEKLIAEGKMKPAGLKVIEDGKASGNYHKPYSLKGDTDIPEDFMKAMRKRPKAWEFFQSMANSNKFAYIHQINALKRPDSRAERITKVVRLLELNIKPYEKGVKSINLDI